MAVANQTPYKEYIGNGTTKIFPLEFDCDDADHLIVKVNDIEVAALNNWSLNTNTGSVVFAIAPISQSKIILQRDTPLVRDTDYQTYNNSFKPQPVNNDFDKIWLKLQELGVTNWLTDTDIKNLSVYVNSLNEETRDDFFNKLGNLEQNTNAMLEEAIKNGAVSALAITTVNAVADLNALSKWDGRTVAVAGIGNYKYSSSTDTWSRDFITDRQVITVDSVADLLNLDKWPGRTVKTKSYNTINYSLEYPFSGNMTYTYDSNRALENDGGSVIYGWVANFPEKNCVNVDWFGADPNGVLDSTNAVKKAQFYISKIPNSLAINTKNFGKVMFSAGTYRGSNIPIMSFVNYEGKGEYATGLIPALANTMFFITLDTQSVLPQGGVYTRCDGYEIRNITFGLRYAAQSAPSVPIPANAGGIDMRFASRYTLENVTFNKLTGTALKVVETWDCYISSVKIFECGNIDDINNPVPALLIDRGANDVSNAMRFEYLRMENNKFGLHIRSQTRHCVFDKIKIEAGAGAISNVIEGGFGIVFDNPELTWASDTVPMFDIRDDSTNQLGNSDTSGIVFNSPQLISSTRRGFYFKHNSNGAALQINNIFARNVAKIIEGNNYQLNGGNTYDCGKAGMNLILGDWGVSVTEQAHLALRGTTATDGSEDTIKITGYGAKVTGNTFTSLAGSASDGGAYINLLSAVNPICSQNKFGGFRQYGMRYVSTSPNVKDNILLPGANVAAIQSGTFPSHTVIAKNVAGLGVGDIKSSSTAVSAAATGTTNIAQGGSLLLLRTGNSSALFFIEAASATVTKIAGSDSVFDIWTGSGSAGDGKIYVSKAVFGSLTFRNYTNASATIYALVLSAVAT